MKAILRRALFRSMATLALLSTACLDDGTVDPDPNDGATGPAVRLGFHATILGATAGQIVHIRAYYQRLDGTAITLESTPTQVSVTPGVPQQVAVVVKIAQCLADPQHSGGVPNRCEVGIALRLEDEGGTVIDEQTSPPSQPLPPGSTTTIAEPIVFNPVTQVTFGSIPVLRESETRTLTASALDGQGTATSRKISWSSDNTRVLTIDPATGAATGVGVGSARVTATAGVRSATATVRVIRRVTSVVLSPDPAPVVRAAATLALLATPKAADGTDAGDLPDRAITWNAVNPAGTTRTASVSTTGVVTGAFPGDADVTVSVDGVTKTVRLRIIAAAVRVQSPTTLVVVGTKLPHTATVVDANEAPLANIPVTWSTSDPAIATVDATGMVTAVAQGLAVITATGGGVSGFSPVHITSLALDVQPRTAEIGTGTTVQFSATNAIGPVTWSTSNPSIAEISATGLVTASQPGTVTVIGTTSGPFGVQRGTAELSVFRNDSLEFVGSRRAATPGASTTPVTVNPSPRK